MFLPVLKKKFIEFEEKHQLFEASIDGLKFWQYLRYDIFLKILKTANPLYEKAQDDIDKSLQHGVKRFFQASFLLFSGKDALMSKTMKKDIIIFPHPRKKLVNDEYISIYTEYLLRNLNIDHLNIEWLYDAASASANKNTKYLQLELLITYLYRKLVPFRLNAINRRLLKSIQDSIVNELNTQLDLYKAVCEILKTRKVYFRLYKKIFRKYHPKIILEVVSYSLKQMILNDFCKKHGILTVELQHGIIDSSYLAYDFPRKMSLDIFPDYFFSFGDYWNQAANFPIPNEHLKSVGFPYFEQEAKKYNNIKKTDKIVFISQGPIGKELSKFAVELANLTTRPIIYKLHPGEYQRWQTEYQWILNHPSIQIIDNDNFPLYQLFAEASVVVGVFSMALYECMMFGPSIYIVKLPGYEALMDLISHGFATLISTPNEFMMKITESGEIRNIKIERDFFFKSNSIENQKHELLEILKQSD